MQIIGAEVFADGLGQRIGGQRTGGDDHRAFRNLRYLTGDHGDIGVISQLFGDHGREAVAIHRKAAACLHTGGIGALQDDAVQPPQLFLQKTHRIFQAVTTQRIGANQLTEVFAVMGGAHFLRLHFVKLHGNAPLRQLPGRFRTGQTGADDFYGFHQASPFFLRVVVFLAVVFLAAVFLAAVFFLAGAFLASSSAAASAASTEAAGFL